MTDSVRRQGQCLCGAVNITANATGHDVGTCHCKMCRRWGGGPFMEMQCGKDVVFEGHENLSIFESSAWAERGFCNRCGTHLFYRIKANGEHFIPVGLFDDDDSLVLASQVFIDEKPSYYTFAEETHKMTGAEVFAKYQQS